MTALTIQLATTACDQETHSVVGVGVKKPGPILLKSESGISWRTKIIGMLIEATLILDKRWSMYIDSFLSRTTGHNNHLKKTTSNTF